MKGQGRSRSAGTQQRGAGKRQGSAVARGGAAAAARGGAARRSAELRRRTRETDIRVSLAIGGSGRIEIATGIGFFDHMLSALALHGGFDLSLRADGDLHVDQHHLVEDCGIAFGEALLAALGDRKGIERSGYFAFPMEESLAIVAVDLGGRASLQWRGRFRRERVGDLETDTIPEFLRGVTRGLTADIHAVLPYGWNDHHKAESLFKALGKALKVATSRDGRYAGLVPSTKGAL